MEILLDVIAVEPRSDFKLILAFENGDKRCFDMKPFLVKKPFVKLKTPAFFMRAKVGYGTVVWPDGIDIAPETLWDGSIPLSSVTDSSASH